MRIANWSVEGKCLISKQILSSKGMYGDHCEEFVCGYWGLKRFSVKFCHLRWIFVVGSIQLKFPEVSALPFSNCNVLPEKITVFKMTVFLGWNGNSPQEGIKEARLTHSICLHKIDCIPLVDFLSFFVRNKVALDRNRKRRKSGVCEK